MPRVVPQTLGDCTNSSELDANNSFTEKRKRTAADYSSDGGVDDDDDDADFVDAADAATEQKKSRSTKKAKKRAKEEVESDDEESEEEGSEEKSAPSWTRVCSLNPTAKKKAMGAISRSNIFAPLDAPTQRTINPR